MVQDRQTEIKFSPSILAADQARLGEQVVEATEAGADFIHVDVLDGRFAPNLSVGPSVVAAIRDYTGLPLDVHLMIVEPEKLIPDFVKAGSDILTVHIEACTNPRKIVSQVKNLGKKIGIAINPTTPLNAVVEIIPEVDRILLMTVNPGFPGQQFIPAMLEKVVETRRFLDHRGLLTELGVDGGINSSNASAVVEAGARILAIGSSAFNKRRTVREGLDQLRASLHGS